MPVLDGVDLELGSGAVLALLGANGAGKTTTVRVLATLLRPDAGTATVAGYDVVTQPRRCARRSASPGSPPRWTRSRPAGRT